MKICHKHGVPSVHMFSIYQYNHELDFCPGCPNFHSHFHRYHLNRWTIFIEIYTHIVYNCNTFMRNWLSLQFVKISERRKHWKCKFLWIAFVEMSYVDCSPNVFSLHYCECLSVYKDLHQELKVTKFYFIEWIVFCWTGQNQIISPGWSSRICHLWSEGWEEIMGPGTSTTRYKERCISSNEGPELVYQGTAKSYWSVIDFKKIISIFFKMPRLLKWIVHYMYKFKLSEIQFCSVILKDLMQQYDLSNLVFSDL